MTAIPPGPWRWQQVDPALLYRREHPARPGDPIDEFVSKPAVAQGWALVAADGTPVLLCESGWGTPDIAGGVGGLVAELLARAWELAN